MIKRNVRGLRRHVHHVEADVKELPRTKLGTIQTSKGMIIMGCSTLNKTATARSAEAPKQHGVGVGNGSQIRRMRKSQQLTPARPEQNTQAIREGVCPASTCPAQRVPATEGKCTALETAGRQHLNHLMEPITTSDRQGVESTQHPCPLSKRGTDTSNLGRCLQKIPGIHAPNSDNIQNID